LESGVFDIILEHIRSYSSTNQKILDAKTPSNLIKSQSKSEDIEMDAQIDSKNLN
jgi:hypothetical protein